MMPQIVLNTTFTPGLPVVPVVGFSDEFTRPNASSLGVTPLGKPWNVMNSGATTVTAGIDSDAAYCYADAGRVIAVVDAGTVNVEVTAKMRTLPDNAGALALWATAPGNALRLAARKSGSERNWYLEEVIGGSANALAYSAVPSANGDVIRSASDGQVIRVWINGALAITATTSLTLGTRFGIYAGGTTTSAFRVDSMSVYG